MIPRNLIDSLIRRCPKCAVKDSQRETRPEEPICNRPWTYSGGCLRRCQNSLDGHILTKRCPPNEYDTLCVSRRFLGDSRSDVFTNKATAITNEKAEGAVPKYIKRSQNLVWSSKSSSCVPRKTTSDLDTSSKKTLSSVPKNSSENRLQKNEDTGSSQKGKAFVPEYVKTNYPTKTPVKESKVENILMMTKAINSGQDKACTANQLHNTISKVCLDKTTKPVDATSRLPKSETSIETKSKRSDLDLNKKHLPVESSKERQPNHSYVLNPKTENKAVPHLNNQKTLSERISNTSERNFSKEKTNIIKFQKMPENKNINLRTKSNDQCETTQSLAGKDNAVLQKIIDIKSTQVILKGNQFTDKNKIKPKIWPCLYSEKMEDNPKKDQQCINDFKHKIEAYTRNIDLKKNTAQPQNTVVRAFGDLNKTITLIKPDQVTRTETKSKRIIKSHNVESVLLSRRKSNGAKNSLPFSKIPMTAPTRSEKPAPLQKDSGINIVSKTNSVVSNPKYFAIQEFMAKNKAKLRSSIKKYIEGKKKLLTYNLKDEIEDWKKATSIQKKLQETKSRLRKIVAQKSDLPPQKKGNIIKKKKRFRPNATSIPLKKTQLLKDDALQLQNDIKKAHSEASNSDSHAMSTDAFNVLTDKYNKTLFKSKTKTFKDIVREKEMKKVREKFDEAPIQVMQRNLELEASQNEAKDGSENCVGKEVDGPNHDKIRDSIKPGKPKDGLSENANKMLDIKIRNKKALFKNVNDNFGKQRLESKSSYTSYPSGCLKKPELLLETMTLKHECALPLPSVLSLIPQTPLKEQLGNVELKVGSKNDLGAVVNKEIKYISANESTKLPEERKGDPPRETISKMEISSRESSDHENRFACDKSASDNPVKHTQSPINQEYDAPIDNNTSILTITSDQSSTNRKKDIQNIGDSKIKEQEQTTSFQEYYYEPQSESIVSLGGDNLPKEMVINSTGNSKEAWLSPLDEDRHIHWEDSDLKPSIGKLPEEIVTHKYIKNLNVNHTIDGVIKGLKETTNVKEGVDQEKTTSVILEKELLNMSKSQETGNAIENPVKQEKYNFLKNPVKNNDTKLLRTKTVHSARTTASNQEIGNKFQKSITESTPNLMSAYEEILKNVNEDHKTENCVNHRYKSRSSTIRNSDKTEGSSFYNFLYRFFNDSLEFKSSLQPLTKRNISSNPVMKEDLKNDNNDHYKNFLSSIFANQAPTHCERKHSIKPCNETLGNDASCNNTISKKVSESKPSFFGFFSDVLKSMKSDNESIISGKHESDNKIKGNRETSSNTQNERVKKNDSHGNADVMNSTNAAVIPIKMDSTTENMPQKDSNVNKTKNKMEVLDNGLDLPEGLHEETYVCEKTVPRVLGENHLRTDNIVKELLEHCPQLSKLNEESTGNNSRIPTLVLKSHQKSNLIKQEHEIIKTVHIGMSVEKTVTKEGKSVVDTKGEGSKEDLPSPVKNSLQKGPKDRVSNSQSENTLQNKARNIFSKNDDQHSSNDTKSNVSRTECQHGDSTHSRHINNSIGERRCSTSRKVENSQYQEPKPPKTEKKGKFLQPSETSALSRKGVGRSHECVESKAQGIPESHMPKSTLQKHPPKSKTEPKTHNTSGTTHQGTLHECGKENKRDILNNNKEKCQRDVKENHSNRRISVNKDPLLEALKNLCLQYEGAVDNYKSKTLSISVKPELELKKKSEWNDADFIKLWEPSKSIYTDSLCTKPFKLPKKKSVSPSGNKENTNLKKRKGKLDKEGEELKSHGENVSSNLKSSKFIFSKKTRTDKMKSKEKCIRLKEVPIQKRRKESNLMRDLLTAKDGILSLLQWENKISRTITNPELFWNGANTEYNSNDVLTYIKNKR